MRVEQLGEGTPTVAIVAGIHGDEPGGVAAIDSLVEASPPVERPVLLVVVNERALSAGVRYVDRDLNRAFPGDPSQDAHESMLADELADLLDGCTVLSLHSTQSHPDPFMVVDRVDPLVEQLATQLPLESVVDTGEYIQGRLFAAVRTVEVECGLQGSDAAASTALRLSLGYLRTMDVLTPEVADDLAAEFGVAPLVDPDPSETPVYRLTEQIPKEHDAEYEVLVDNFDHVERGTAFARNGHGDVVADEPFYPVLLSADGYEEILGYAGQRQRIVSRTAAQK